jgi:predicted Zn-dependent peptidase
MLKHKIDKLTNGLTVLRVAVPGVESVATLVLANTGSRYEKEAQYGIAHFFEHMAFKGTQRYPSSELVAAAIDGIGADFNAFTGTEYTGYYVRSSAAKVEKALDVLGDMLATPLLKQDDIEREKGVIIEELNMYRDLPQARVEEAFDKMVFAGSTLEHQIIGNKETIMAMTSDNFRAWLNDWYDASNLTLVLAGEAQTVHSDELLALVEKYFGVLPQRMKNPQHEQFLSKNFTYNGRFVYEEMPIEQAHFVLGWPGLKLSDERQPISTVMTTIFGSSMSSRLFTEIREKRGLCYYIGASDSSSHDSGILSAQAGVNLHKTAEAVEVTRDEFVKAAQGEKLVTADELTRAKDYLRGKQTLGLENTLAVAQSYGLRQMLLGEVLTPAEKLAKIEAVTLEEVNALVKEICQPGQLKLSVVGKLTSQQVEALDKLTAAD